MNRFQSLIIIALIAVLAVGSAIARDERNLPNMIYNPSFEKLTYEPVFTGEEIVAVASGRREKHAYFWSWRPDMAIDNKIAHTGKVSVRVDGPAEHYTTNKVGYYVYERGSGTYLIPGKKYTLSAWVKTKDVTGKGIRISMQGKPTVYTEWVNGTTGWTKIQVDLHAPEIDHTRVHTHVPGGHIRIHWDVNEGGTVWIDEVSLVPESGKLEKAPAPTITPSGGTFKGRKYVELKSDLPGAVIHYTVDGQEPDRFDVEYVGPFLVDGPTVVKAKVFHTAYESATSQARFEIKAKVGTGVPFYPTGWGMDVEKWWSNHIYNPDSPNFFEGPIISPEPRVDVGKVLEQNPDSKTGGIAEALELLPQDGGTLWFPKAGGPYIVKEGMTITGRSNLHFLSDGAEIRMPKDQIRFYSDHAVNWRRFVLNPVENFYFNNIHFTGSNTNEKAMYFRHCVDILIDNCTFTKFGTGQRRNIISANVNTDNIWYRNCVFKDNTAGFPTYWDGIHNAGCINCEFSGDYGGGDFLIFTNNDMSPFCAYQRTGQYIVFDSCTFIGEPGREGRNALAITPSNVLITDNICKGPFESFVKWNGRGKSNTQPRLHFSGAGMKVVNNKVENVNTFIAFDSDVAQYHRKHQFTMDNVARGNDVRGIEYLFTWVPAYDPHHPPYERLENVTFTNNVFTSDRIPQVKLLADSENEITRITVGDKEVDVKVIDPNAMKRIKDVTIKNNTIRVVDPVMIVDRDGEDIEHKQIQFKDNNITVQNP